MVISRPFLRLGKRFWRDRRGVSAIEFALIAPAMIAFYFGMAEMTQAMMADRRNAHVASAVGDLVAQSAQVSDSDTKDIFKIAQAIIAPFPDDTLKVRVSSVTANSKGAKVDWSDSSGMSRLNPGDPVTLPPNLLPAGQSLVMAESTYSYSSPIGYFIPSAVQYSEKVYLKPRKSSIVTHK